MCTAATYNAAEFCFGRTLDNEFSFGEKVTVTPRNFQFSFTDGCIIPSHFAIIGMAYIQNDYPLYFDAMNEKGLCMAGLNFVGNAFFGKEKKGCYNVAVYEFIPWILCQCQNVKDAEILLERINLTDTPFSNILPAAELHWIIADKNKAITVECMKDGLHVYNNSVGVLTNNPPFPFQMHNLNNFMCLSPRKPENRFSSEIDFEVYSKGMGAVGLPGDWSSQSRFVKTVFAKMNSVRADEKSCVSQLFRILGSVSHVDGCTKTSDGNEITIYTACMNADKGIYYFITHKNRQISAVDMHSENLDDNCLFCYETDCEEQIRKLN